MQSIQFLPPKDDCYKSLPTIIIVIIIRTIILSVTNQNPKIISESQLPVIGRDILFSVCIWAAICLYVQIWRRIKQKNVPPPQGSMTYFWLGKESWCHRLFALDCYLGPVVFGQQKAPSGGIEKMAYQLLTSTVNLLTPIFFSHTHTQSQVKSGLSERSQGEH